jgi:nucleoside-diphosphate-sugar epimerase
MTALNGPAFVTGATGFIGTRLVQALTERGIPVRALSRREHPESPPGLDGPPPLDHELVTLVRGDITDRDSLVRGMEGCRQVYHLAAYAKNWAPDPNTFREMNVAGMQNVFEAARQHQVQRVVWTSTILTLGFPPKGVVGDEQMARPSDKYLTAYEETKVAAEREAVRQAAEGLPVVIVNPTRVYGPGHMTEGNSLARLIDDYDRGRVPILLNRGVNVGNYVMVDDVVQGHLLAMAHGRIGERYILGGDNVTLKEFFRTIDRISGKRHLQIPMFSLSPLVFSWFQLKRAQWFGAHPVITPGWIRTFISEGAFRSDKAINELGYKPTPLEEGLTITYQWLLRVRKERS